MYGQILREKLLISIEKLKKNPSLKCRGDKFSLENRISILVFGIEDVFSDTFSQF
jgi:hypothetical protein